jgi:predicted ATPase
VYISNFQLNNYKSFDKSVTLKLTTGFNLITGANNVGKTALLEGLGLRFSSVPHRSVKTIGRQPQEMSTTSISFTLTNDELWEILRKGTSRQLRTQMPSTDSEVARSLAIGEHDADAARRFWDWIFKNESYRFDLQFQGMDDNQKMTRWRAQEDQSCSLFSIPACDLTSYCDFDPHKRTFNVHGAPVNAKDQVCDLGCDLALTLAGQVYSFEAERFALGRCKRETESELLPDAANLANVLNYLDDNPSKFRDYMELVKEVLPQIKQVGVRSYRDPTYVEVVVWTEDAALRNNDLAFSLSECGTGVGQVLAILYVVYTSPDPRAIIIDEPQSFLHPGAIRKLIDILHRYSKHQFIIATHAPTVITAAHANTIALVTQDTGESAIRTLDARKAEDQMLYLSEVGASLADVFGADQILWVEGKTEERCFPTILERLSDRRLSGTAIIGVLSPGDLRGRHKETIHRIYDRLSASAALIPPAVGFVFDRDGLTQREEDDLARMTGSKIHFLNRRMYENYLLNPRAITSLINTLDTGRAIPLVESEVEEWLNSASKNPLYFRSTALKDDHGDDWLKNIDGASVLDGVFSALSEKRVTYLKVVHGLALTEWLIENDPTGLKDLAKRLVSILDMTQAEQQ